MCPFDLLRLSYSLNTTPITPFLALPNADIITVQKELDRLDLKHHIMMLLCDNHLHLAPLVNPGRVLDIGTGTGIWAIQMGDQYPESTIIGTDLSPIQPSWYEPGHMLRSE